jgi:hypothetical protein
MPTIPSCSAYSVHSVGRYFVILDHPLNQIQDSDATAVQALPPSPRKCSSTRCQSRARPQFDVRKYGGLHSIRGSWRRCCGADELSNGPCIGFLASPQAHGSCGTKNPTCHGSITQRSHSSINNSLFDWRMIS